MAVPPSQPAIDGRIHVTREELERAIAVWLRLMPRDLWAGYLRMLEIDPKRRTETDRADPVLILSAYLADRFDQARWQASYREPVRPPG
jgi:hypothetical protein